MESSQCDRAKAILYNNTRYSHSYRMRVGNRPQAFEWYHFPWPRITSNPYFKVTYLFDAEYLRNGRPTRHRHICNGIINGTYTSSRRSFRMALSDLEWVSEIFNDTKHSAVSLRQLSFLFFFVWTWMDLSCHSRSQRLYMNFYKVDSFLDAVYDAM